MSDVKVDHIKQLVENLGIGGLQKRLEDIHEELLIEWIKIDVSMVIVVIIVLKHLNGVLLLLRRCESTI